MNTNLLKLGMQYFAEPSEPTEPPADPTDPAEPTEPTPKAPEAPAEPEGTRYTAKQLEELKKTWETEYKQQQSVQKAFEEMTPEEQAQKLLADQQAENERLQAQIADRDLTDYARGLIAKEELPADSLDFIKGKDEQDTDKRATTFKAMLANGIQEGVEKRFKGNGYTPRGSSSGLDEGSSKRTHRGVSITTGE